MGILFCKNNDLEKKINTYIENNDIKIINNIQEIDNVSKNVDKLCIKIHILGTGEKKKYIINNIFNNNVSNQELKDRFKVDKEYKSDQFHWIAHIYKDEILTDEICKEIKEEIKSDRNNAENENYILKNQIILCFENENTKIISKNFINFSQSNMIFITKEICEVDKVLDKRYALNIVYKNLTDKDLNVKLISSLWELDCYFKEKGNLICRYTPEKIFNDLEKDNSLFSLNILLLGKSRVGKSTFVNLFTRKLTALETDESVSVTNNLSEYYIYKDDEKNTHGAIKLIDTPGIVADRADILYKKKEKEIIDLIQSQKGNISFEKKIHFIFFILRKGDNSYEGENIKEIFKNLNDCKCPVYFIINEVKENDKIKKIKEPIKEYLNKNGFNNISKGENFIPANFKIGNVKKIYGIDKIFTKIKNYIQEKNIIDQDLKKEMDDVFKDFRSKIETDDAYLNLEEDDLKTILELKKNIKFEERMNKIEKKISNNEFFNSMKLGELFYGGRIRAEICRNVILSFSDLKDSLPDDYEKIPIISVYQACMVKEIGAGYGLDINILNSGTKLLMKYIKKLPNVIPKDNIKIDKFDDINKINVDKYSENIQNKAINLLENKKNKETNIKLAKLIEEIKTKEDNNINFTIDLYKFCIIYFEKELIESQSLCFLVNFMNKLQLIYQDLDYYINKKDWENYEMAIKQ